MDKATARPSLDAFHLDPWSEMYRLLGELLAEAGSFSLPEDLYGASGAPFRTHWHLRESAGAPRRWSSRSAGVSAGDPIAVAAEAYGFRVLRGGASRGEEGSLDLDRLRREERSVLVCVEGRWTRHRPESAPAGPAGASAWIAVLPPREPVSIEHRIRAIERSIAIGMEDFDRPALMDGGIFASGAAAFAAFLDDLGGPLDRFLPETREEAARLTPEIAASPGRDLVRLSPAIALGRTLSVFGAARRSLVTYLDRAANFVDVNGGISFFRKEGDLLLAAAGRVLRPIGSAGAGELLSARLEAVLPSDRARRRMRKEIRAAAKEHRRGVEALRTRLAEARDRSRGPSPRGSATMQP